MIKKANAYGSKEKLKNKERITQLFEEGKVLKAYPLKLIYLRVEEQDVAIKAGVAVPKRNFKSAVKRNRIKRLMREAYRLNKGLVFNNTQRNFAFLFLYLGKEMPSSEQIALKMKLLLNNFNVQKHEKST
ncbi:ribonuclease P protein component [Maribacter sp. R77961]|uniref:ribonuclease P protein component n=1 Tax=Maribacter sp. R77961 TaxID=3093871 RepID=UPI0037CB7E05